MLRQGHWRNWHDKRNIKTAWTLAAENERDGRCKVARWEMLSWTIVSEVWVDESAFGWENESVTHGAARLRYHVPEMRFAVSYVKNSWKSTVSVHLGYTYKISMYPQQFETFVVQRRHVSAEVLSTPLRE